MDAQSILLLFLCQRNTVDENCCFFFLQIHGTSPPNMSAMSVCKKGPIIVQMMNLVHKSKLWPQPNCTICLKKVMTNVNNNNNVIFCKARAHTHRHTHTRACARARTHALTHAHTQTNKQTRSLKHARTLG